MKQILNTILIVACCATTAQAGWLGDSVTAAWYSPDNVTVIETHNLVVAPTVELPFGSIANAGNNLQIDLSDTQIEFDFANLAIWTVSSFNGWRFSDTYSTIPPIIGVTLGPMSPGISGLTPAALSFDADNIWANYSGVTAAGAGDYWTLDVKFGEPTPEPSSFVLAAAGLVALAAMRRRK